MTEPTSEPTSAEAATEAEVEAPVVMTAAGANLHPAERTPHEVATGEPERLLVVPALQVEGETRYVLVRWPDWPYPALLSLAPPVGLDTLERAAADLVQARLGLEAAGEARLAELRVPVRMGAPRMGLQTTGSLRGVLQPVAGEPHTDVLLEGFDVLTLAEAEAALTTEVERMVLRAAAALE